MLENMVIEFVHDMMIQKILLKMMIKEYRNNENGLLNQKAKTLFISKLD